MPESYAHIFAKELLVHWLRSKAVKVKVSQDGDYSLVALDPIRALVPQNDPHLGVYIEYPICNTTSGSTTLLEPWPADGIPTYDDLIAKNKPPAYILDIAILHFGQIKYGIEVVHQHPVPDAKISILQIATHQHPFELYQINASWILNNCQPPHRLQMERLIPGTRRNLPFPTA